MQPLILGLYGLSKNNKDVSGYKIIRNNEALNILKKAWELGIKFVDTAPSYGKGNADYLIKKSRSLNYNFKLISKIGLNVQNNKFNEDNDLIKKDIINLRNNHDGNINSVLLHSPTKQFLSKKDNLLYFYDNVNSILGKDINVGISLRNPQDLIYLEDIERNFLIETNLSWFDLRILNYLNNKNISKFKIIARSIFASGILKIIYENELNNKEFFNKNDIRSSWDLDKLFSKNIADIKRFKNVKSILNNLSFSETVFSLFPIISSIISGVIIGPLSLKELLDSDKSNIKNLSLCENKDLENIINIYNSEFFELISD